MQNKITLNHLSLIAYIYIRQSSMQQVLDHEESQRLQYQLAERARDLGWAKPVIVDNDLARSATGHVDRHGFDQLLLAVTEQKVGAIFCVDASRLARNNREWSQLVYYCALTKTLIIDTDGIYDPSVVTDRAFLGMKGTLSEYESLLFRQRTQAAILGKAGRGEFVTHVPAGYKRTEKNRYEMDPDKRVQDALFMVFKKFLELGSITQLVRWYHQQQLLIPCNIRGNKIIWKLPTTSTISNILKNPIYAGAYVYGRSQRQIQFVNGQLRVSVIQLPMDEWKVVIPDHHKAYISWDEFLANQQQLKQNVNKRGVIMKAAPKNGSALLVSLLRCKRCGRKFRVRYSSSHSGFARYICQGQENIGKTENCISFHGRKLEELVSREIMHVVEPAAILAAERAEQLAHQTISDQQLQISNALKQAEYEANRCFEQYDLVDPRNRLVAQNLEKNWNNALAKVDDLKRQLEDINTSHKPMSEQQREALYQLANNLPAAWNHPKADVKLKKRILQTLIHEIMVDIDDDNHLDVTIHWKGGKHTQYHVKRRKQGHRDNYLHPDTEQIITGLAEVVPDQDIARILNLLKITTASGMTWSANRVKDFRNRHHIPVFNQTEYDKKGWVNLQQAAEILQTHPETISRLIKANVIKARQVIKYSPWIIDKEQLETAIIKSAVSALEKGNKTVVNKNQIKLNLQLI